MDELIDKIIYAYNKTKEIVQFLLNPHKTFQKVLYANAGTGVAPAFYIGRLHTYSATCPKVPIRMQQPIAIYVIKLTHNSV